MKVLVLGGAGYIGSHTVRALIAAGCDVVVADNLATGYRKAVAEQAKFYQGDIRDFAFLDDLFQKEQIDCVIHFAANSLVGESVTNPLKYYDNNLYGTKVLLDAMVANDVKMIVFSSTAATYGETKLAMEKMFYWSERAYGIRYVSLRYFNAAGADASGEIGEAHSPETHLIPLVLKAANGTRDGISIFGTDYDTKDGTCVRDYIHVTDLASAHVLAMHYLAAGNPSDVFNLGNGVGFTVREVIDVSKQVTGREFKVGIEERRAGDPAVLIASSEKAKRVLGWKPQHADLEDIIRSAWNWHQNHPQGYGEA